VHDIHLVQTVFNERSLALTEVQKFVHLCVKIPNSGAQAREGAGKGDPRGGDGAYGGQHSALPTSRGLSDPSHTGQDMTKVVR
jgi:hypothetical protein